MKEEGPDVGLLFVMIFGLLFGMALVSLTSCEEQKPQKETFIFLGSRGTNKKVRNRKTV
jgi:hypothetical protein